MRTIPDLEDAILAAKKAAVHDGEAGGRRRRRRRHHHQLRVRMRFAWWQFGVAILSIAFGGWLVLALQPWHARPTPALSGDR